jgi:DNA-binding MarR family transcriptional regulator
MQGIISQKYSDALELDRQFSEQLGINALRPEAKLLLILSETGALTIKQAHSLSGLSYRGFYLLLNRLLKNGFIEINSDEHDRRVRKVKLARSILQIS